MVKISWFVFQNSIKRELVYLKLLPVVFSPSHSLEYFLGDWAPDFFFFFFFGVWFFFPSQTFVDFIHLHTYEVNLCFYLQVFNYSGPQNLLILKVHFTPQTNTHIYIYKSETKVLPKRSTLSVSFVLGFFFFFFLRVVFFFKQGWTSLTVTKVPSSS